jgi:magnesium and cobalt exporter, CNNM family
MPAIGVELVVILLLILANGVFALAEMALVSARKARLQEWAEAGHVRARAALALAEDPGAFLSTVQIGITVVGILAGAFGGARLAAPLAAALRPLPGVGPYHETLSLGLVVGGITYLSLVVGELVPKQLALTSPERLATVLAGPMRLVSRLASPAVRLLSLSTAAVLRLCRVRPAPEPPVTAGEVRHLMEQGAQAGVFEAAEHEMVRGVFRLGNRRISALMTPRTDIVWLDLEDPPEEQRRRVTETVHSWVPVGRGALDHLVGVARAKDLLAPLLTGQVEALEAVIRPPVVVPESLPALQVLERFRQAGLHLALVVDEYGAIQGLVTPLDLLEALVGDLPDAGLAAEPAVVRREDGSWLVDGRLPADELKALLPIGALPGEETGVYQTVSGLVMQQLERIPATGDQFPWGGFRFEVVDMDGHRVDKVLVTPLPAEATPEPAGS